MVAFAWVIRSSTPVSVEGMGVTITWGMLKTKRAIPWDDIERLDEGRMSARLVRRSNGKRVFFALLDPGWQERPVTIAIRRQFGEPLDPSDLTGHRPGERRLPPQLVGWVLAVAPNSFPIHIPSRFGFVAASAASASAS